MSALASSHINKIAKRFFRLESEERDYLDFGHSAQQKNIFAFEIAWEVCNKGMIELNFEVFGFNHFTNCLLTLCLFSA
jgi:hypothetical protein